MELADELRAVLNRHSAENPSGTPDFILAEYLLNCLAAFDVAVNARAHWFDHPNHGECSGITDPFCGIPRP